MGSPDSGPSPSRRGPPAPSIPVCRSPGRAGGIRPWDLSPSEVRGEYPESGQPPCPVRALGRSSPATGRQGPRFYACGGDSCVASRSGRRERRPRGRDASSSLSSSPHPLLLHIFTLGSFGLQDKLQGLGDTSGHPPTVCHLTWPCCPQGVQCPAPRQLHLESLLPGNPLPCSVPSTLGSAPGNCRLLQEAPQAPG